MDSLYEPVKPVRPALPHDLDTVITTARLCDFLAVDELKQIREVKGGKERGGKLITFG
jgi:hypothetical protein